MAVQIDLRIVIVFTVFSAVNPSIPEDGDPTVLNASGSMDRFDNLSQLTTYPKKTWPGGEETFLRNAYRVNPKTRSLMTRSDDVTCRASFTRDMKYKNCVSLCVVSSCINGKCVGSTECKCDVGYIKSQTHSFICHPRCKSTHFNGGTGLQRCTCDKGYRLSPNQQTCEPICDQIMCNGKLCIAPQNCYRDSSNHKIRYGQFCSRECGFGECVGPDTCKCFDGYTKNKDGQCSVPICIPECVHGECVSPNTCKCLDGYRLNSYDPCREPICDKGCVNGDCVALNTCKCWHGYNKTEDGQCLQPICRWECKHGYCVGPNNCKCLPGYRLNNFGQCLDPICKGGCGNGNCVAPNKCNCLRGYRVNNFGQCSDPICNEECGQGECVAPNTCKCWHGYNKTEDGQCLHLFCSRGCGHGKCVAPNKCNCTDGYGMNTHGQCLDPICKGGCGNGKCVAPHKCECIDGYRINTHGQCLDPICNEGCRNGNCVGPETCRCDDGFFNPKSNNGTCVKCKLECDHGKCSDNGCYCFPGWTGESCTESLWCAIKNRHNFTHTASERKEMRGTINTTKWDGPICKEECSDHHSNRNSNATGYITDMGYPLIDIDSPCNLAAWKTFLMKNKIILIGAGIGILFFGFFISVIVAVKRRAKTRGRNRSKPAETDGIDLVMVDNEIYS